MDPDDTGWKSLRRSVHKALTHKPQTGMEVSDGQGRVPSALVHPFPSGEDDTSQREGGNIVPNLPHRPQYSITNLPSPYLLDHQPSAPATPTTGLVRSSPSITLNLGHTLHCSTDTRNLELDSLRHQVREIQNRLNGDIKGSQEYQQLLSEKLYLEDTLGSTEYSLQQLRTAYNDLKKSSSATEQEYLLKLNKAQKYNERVSEERDAAQKQIEQLRDYLRELPTAAEHQQLQVQLVRCTEDIACLNNKTDYLSKQLQRAEEREGEQTAAVKMLTQERDDLALKLSLTNDILQEFNCQRQTAHDKGQQDIEDVLWTLEQTKKELDSAKKLLGYRKEKIESLHKELVTQDKKHCELLQVEAEEREKLEEKMRQLQQSSQHDQQELEQVKAKLATAEEKKKLTEEKLALALGEMMSQQKISSVITALLSNLHTALSQLRDLVSISQQISQGQTPDVALLLNITDSSEDDHSGSLSMEALTDQLREVKSLVQGLENVRTQLQEQYAKQLAKDVTCAQM